MNTSLKVQKVFFKCIYPISNTQNVASPMLTYFLQDSHYSTFLRNIHHSLFCLFQTYQQKLITDILIWLISLGVMCLRSINVAVCFLVPAFILLSSLPLYKPPLLYLSVTRHLPHFQFGALMNKAAVNIHMKSLWRHMFSFSFLVHMQKRNCWVIWYMHA